MLTVIGSIKGSPGATSTGLALAASWPRPCVLVEADPAGGDLAYRCRGEVARAIGPDPNLLTLATTVRRGTNPGFNILVEQTQRLACGVNLVQGVISPGRARGLGSLWPQLAHTFMSADADVIVDMGRVDGTSEVLAVAAAASAVLVVGHADMSSVAHLKAGITELAGVLNRNADSMIVPVLVGPDSTSKRDCGDLDQILAAGGLPVTPAQPIAHDPRALARLEDGEGPKRLGRTLLLRSAAALAGGLLAETGAGVVA